MGNAWRWGALPGEEREGGALYRIFVEARDAARLFPGVGGVGGNRVIPSC